MAEKRNKSFFWASYADLMTSLFFVMLMLFVVAVVELNKNNSELQDINTKIVLEKDSLTIEKDKLKAQLDKAQEIENATMGLESEYFEYKSEYKKHKLTIDVSFPTGESDIEKHVPEATKNELLAAGKKAKSFVDSTTDNHPGIQYLLIIEGQASRDNYSQNYELSYKRAYSLKKFWEKGGISFSDKNCEVLICGSGDGRQSGTGLMRETNERLNQRFLIHILPKPGVIEQVKKE